MTTQPKPVPALPIPVGAVVSDRRYPGRAFDRIERLMQRVAANWRGYRR